MLVIESHLYKKGAGKLDGWKKRYCRLSSNQRLYYFNTIEESYKVKKIKYIDLSKLKPDAINKKSKHILKKNHAIYGFSIKTKKREWRFCTTSLTTHQKWTTALINVIQNKTLLGFFEQGKQYRTAISTKPKNKAKLVKIFSEKWIYGKLKQIEYPSKSSIETVHVFGSWDGFKKKNALTLNIKQQKFVTSLQLLCNFNYHYRFLINGKKWKINKNIKSKQIQNKLYNVFRHQLNNDDKNFFSIPIEDDEPNELLDNKEEKIPITGGNDYDGEKFEDSQSASELYEEVFTPRGAGFCANDIYTKSVDNFDLQEGNTQTKKKDSLSLIEDTINECELPSSTDDEFQEGFISAENGDDTKKSPVDEKKEEESQDTFSMNFITKSVRDWNIEDVTSWMTTIDVNEYDVSSQDMDACKLMIKIYKISGNKILNLKFEEWNEIIQKPNVQTMIRQELYDFLKQLKQHDELQCKHNVVLNKGVF